ncbi:type III pantothenate kinase [Nonlabens ponticola]|uniref:Type III pantothenate kinase n=1 Tax=Nonlabens ponticola TaxID=2496866 RepID=A0A3S9MWV6_9FLAO|nr:type III pantothenate kinase [Nonlabens ponticola]AZQ43622.1 type III pantothenate kinase [Nonlabens ponticola]
MILAVDIGNTSIKLAVVDETTIYDVTRCQEPEFIDHLSRLFSNYHDLNAACVCQVGTIDVKLLHHLESLVGVMYINHTIKLPFTNKYESTTLGNDRLALVAGSFHTSFEKGAKLIIDAGTCITYDFIDKDNQYLGGAISPGLNLRFKSLNDYTAKLPLLQPSRVKGFLGKNTNDSISTGVIQGTALEIDGMISRYNNKFKDTQVLLTGGDSQLLKKQLKSRFFATPFLMLHGIYNLYKNNS